MCTVDKNCPTLLSHICKVYEDEIELDDKKVLSPFSCVLNLSDLRQNSNKFCILQLLTRKDEAYFLFSRVGRVGYDGVQNIDCFLDKSLAIAAFETEFHERTGIKWCNRYDTDISQSKGKYQFVLMKYDNKETVRTAEETTSSRVPLQKSIANLIETIYDPSLYDAAKSLGLDTKRLPLGNLGAAQIQKAYKILGELGTKDADVVELSSQYYSTIPTACGMQKLPILDSSEKIKARMELLELLEDMCCLKTTENSDIYVKYKKLQCDIEPVTDAHILNLIEKYMQCNRGAHQMKLNVQAVFNLDKLSERNSYRKWDTMHNKQLLWHGTRLANIAGILTSGMRINPVGIPTTGKMFGNGLYFANSSTKSAQYMYMSNNGIGALFLCEVALGNMHELKQSDHVLILPDGKHSTKGVGINQPNEDDHVEVDNNVIIPIGKLMPSDTSGKSLQYDEFIVYDTSQIKLRYLVLVNYQNGFH